MTLMHRSPVFLLIFLGFWVLALPGSARSEGYAPLRVPEGAQEKVLDLTVLDPVRSREIPIRVFLPAQKNPAEVVLFSHGLGGSKEGSAYLGRHWSARDLAVVCLQHPGSDDSVWKKARPKHRMAALRNAAGGKNFFLRIKDVPAVLDQLEQWNREAGHPLAGRLNLERIGMSGHSFGAITTQAVSGEVFGRVSFTDPRIKAAVMFSPSMPHRGRNPEKAFDQVGIPWLLMTGTRDASLIGDADAASRMEVFPALPPGNKYELVLFNAEHSAFSDRPLPGDALERNPNHHQAILAISTAFWEAFLKQDPKAKAWLDGEGPQSILEPKDRWQKK